MKKQNTMIAASLAGAVFFTGFANAQSAGVRDDAILEMFGERGWAVSCQMRQTDGDVINSRERGHGFNGTGRIIVADVMSGTCSYDVPENGALMVSLRTQYTNFECPFTVTADGYCQAQFRAGSEGSFRIRQVRGNGGQTGS